MKKIVILICSVVLFASCEKVEDLVTGFEKSTVTDCEGNEYVTVQIGDQWWMAENLRCVKYDTESERAGATIALSGSTVVFTPYYVRFTATTNYINAGIIYSANLTAGHREKLGYLYNWAAAVGLEDGLVDTVFVEKRQGICPNGWRIPADEDWKKLENYISKHHGGKYKTTTGWFANNNPTEEDPVFAVLPAGYSQGRTVKSLGFSANFLSSTGTSIRSSWSRYLNSRDDVMESFVEMKSYGTSVRCVKNK
jgi:uncharacterized protein (TIGR02145 family)